MVRRAGEGGLTDITISKCQQRSQEEGQTIPALRKLVRSHPPRASEQPWLSITNGCDPHVKTQCRQDSLPQRGAIETECSSSSRDGRWPACERREPPRRIQYGSYHTQAPATGALLWRYSGVAMVEPTDPKARAGHWPACKHRRRERVETERARRTYRLWTLKATWTRKSHAN